MTSRRRTSASQPALVLAAVHFSAARFAGLTAPPVSAALTAMSSLSLLTSIPIKIFGFTVSHFLVIAPGLLPTLVDSSSEMARAVVRAWRTDSTPGTLLGHGLKAQRIIGLPESSDRNFSDHPPYIQADPAECARGGSWGSGRPGGSAVGARGNFSRWVTMAWTGRSMLSASSWSKTWRT